MIKTSNIKIIESQDWDDLVQETYGKSYMFQQQDGCQDRGTRKITIPLEETYDEEMNDSIPFKINGEEMGVKFNVWLNTSQEDIKKEFPDRDERLGLDIFWERNFYPDLQTIANDLYNKGLIEAGEYTINIDW